MKFFRMIAVAIVFVVFIIPVHVVVVLSTDEDEYRAFKHRTQDRMLGMLWGWAYGRQYKSLGSAGIFNA